MFRTLMHGAPVAVALLLAASAARAQDQQPLPSGWLGASLLHGTLGTVVVSVVPNAPAQKAGVVAGDTIISFNGVDAARDGSGKKLWRLLTPGSRITMRLRHNRRVRTAMVVVTRRPQPRTMVVMNGKSINLGLDQSVFGQGIWVFGIGADQDSSNTKGKEPVASKSDDPMVSCSVRGQGIPLQPLLSMFSFGGTMNGLSGILQFAGADLSPVTNDLAAALHVQQEGMFVISVSPGTPARLAGLKGGDVIFDIDSGHRATRAVFQQLLSEKQERDSIHVLLSIVRDGKTRQVALRW